MDLSNAFIEAGFEHDLFNNEQLAIDICQEVIDCLKSHNSYSTIDSRLRSWIHRMRGIKKGNRKLRMGKFYPSLDVMVKKAGYPNMFNSNWNDDFSTCITKFELHAISINQDVIKHYRLYGRYPKGNSKDEEHRRLNRWINRMRKLKKDNRKSRMGKFYPSLQKMADEAGLPNMFNSNWKDDLK